MITSDNIALHHQKCPYSLQIFQYMCVLSGCDYLKSIPGIGIQRAKKAIDQKEQDIDWIIRNLSTLVGIQQLTVPITYKESVQRVMDIFKYHPIIGPLKKEIRPHYPSNGPVLNVADMPRSVQILF